MKRLNLSLLAWFFAMTAFGQYLLSENYIEMNDQHGNSNSLTHKKLRIFPLVGGVEYQRFHADIGVYTTLEEALKGNKVEIVETGSIASPINQSNVFDNEPVNQINNLEQQNDINVRQDYQYEEQQQVQQIQTNLNVGASDQVNKLYIRNTSNDTIYLMAGEVIKGGKQDRVLAQDMILPPDTGLVDLSVFCVEHGRWHYKTTDASKFDAYFSVLANQVRQNVTQAKSQQAVWDAVEDVTNKNQASTSTGTYTALAESEEYQKELVEYNQYFNTEFDKIENCIGFVAVSGDTILGCDIFATNSLFAKQRKNLLNAYITQAITDGAEITIADENVQQYLKEFLLNSDKQDEMINERGIQYQHKLKKLHITRY